MGNDLRAEDQREELLNLIKKSTDSVRMMVFSFFVVSFLLKIVVGASFPIQLFLIELLWIILSFPFFYFTKRIKGISAINNFHLFWIVCELFMLTLIIHFIGGIMWVGPFFYLFFALYENFLFGKRQRIAMLFLTIVFYVGLVFLEFFKFIPTYKVFSLPNLYEDLDYVISTIVVTSGMIIFSFLASDIFRTELENKIGQIFKINRSLLDTQKSLERTNKELLERMKELEKINKFAVGRELKISELKEKIEELEKKLEEERKRK